MSGIPAGAGALLGKRLGKYEILALLALGGTAEIYLARIAGAAGFEKYVVVKCLHDHLADDPEFVKMFLDEARLAATLDHSNIVQTMELGEYENRYFMVMEFLAGLSLAMIVRRAAERLQGGKIPVQLVLNIAAQSCAGLHYAHERTSSGKPLNIVHRDISPQNLVISFEGVVKVVDFGIAKAELRETKTRSGTIKGKFAYMSPEQCVATNVDRRTDVFALGVIAHELLTGQRLFKRASPYETYQAVIECNVAPPSKLNHELDPAIDPIVMKALAKDKEQRYPTAEAFGDAILGYLHHRGKGSGPNDVSRWFDAHFTQEIEEHGARMRELISGRVDAVEDSAKWDGEDEEKRDETVDLGAKADKAITLDTADLAMDRPSTGSLSGVIDELGGGEAAGEDDESLPAERTRIEANPLELLKELDKVPATPRTPTGKTPVPSVLKPQAHKMPPSGPLPLPAPPPGPAPARATPPAGQPQVRSGKFPEAANLPTMIAEPDPEPASAEYDETAIAGDLEGDMAATVLSSDVPGLDSAPVRAHAPTAPAPSSQNQPTTSLRPTQPQPQPQPVPMPQPRPSLDLGGYPVMDAKMSEQVRAGATVFPSDMPRSGAMRAMDSSPRHVPASGPHDPGRAVDLASPVGQQFGEHVDWAAAAAAPARAIPPWMLALFFVGAIGVALAITILIAKLAR